MRYKDAQNLKCGDVIMIKKTKETKTIHLVSVEHRDRQVIIVAEDGKNYNHRKIMKEELVRCLATP